MDNAAEDKGITSERRGFHNRKKIQSGNSSEKAAERVFYCTLSPKDEKRDARRSLDTIDFNEKIK